MASPTALTAASFLVTGQPGLGRQILRLVHDLGVDQAVFVAAADVPAEMTARPVEVVIQAAVLPEDAGFPLIRALRFDTGLARRDFVAVVVGSGVEAHSVARALAAGADDVLQAPVTGARLLRTVDTLMRTRRAYITLQSGYFGPDRRRKHRLLAGIDRRTLAAPVIAMDPIDAAGLPLPATEGAG